MSIPLAGLPRFWRVRAYLGLAVGLLALLPSLAFSGDGYARSYQWMQEQGNLLANWSFENKLDSWIDSSSFGITSKARDSATFTPRTGRYTASISGTTSENVLVYLLKAPRARIVPGQPYTLSFYVRSSGSISTGLYPAVRHRNNKGVVALVQNGKAYSAYADSVSGSSQFSNWTLYRMSITPVDSIQYLEVALLSFVTSGKTATLGFDDVVLEEGILSATEILARRAGQGYSVGFMDASGRSYQSHTRLPENPGMFRVSSTVYDSAGRPFKMPLPFPKTETVPTFATDPVAAANTYYSGSGDTIPNANGYAYSEVQYAADPTSRVVKSGAPGEPWKLAGTKVRESGFWFTDTLAVPVLIKNPVNDTAERNYRLDWSRDEDSVFSLSWTNRRGQVVQIAQRADTGWALTRMEYYPSGQVRRVLTPLDIQLAGEAFAEVRNYNAAGLLTSSYTHDRGLEKFWYNKRGMLRYSQNDRQREINPYVYTYVDYDHLGNIISTGEQVIPSPTPDQDYVVDGNGGQYPYGKTESKGWLYSSLEKFEDRTAVSLDSVTWPVVLYPEFLINMPVAAWNRNVESRVPGLAESDKLMVDLYEYDSLMQLSWQYKYLGSMEQSERLQAAFFTYDAMGRTTLREAFDASSGRLYSTQQYSYDALGRVDTVKNGDFGGDSRTWYGYTPHGPLKRVFLGDESGAKSIVNYGYHIRGWTQDIAVERTDSVLQTYRQVLGYEAKTFNDASVPNLSEASYTGQITQQLYKFTSDVPTPVRAVNYSYDMQGRMTTADYHQGAGLNSSQRLQFPLSLTDTNVLATRVAYDVNGRILGKRSGGVSPEDSARYNYDGESYRLESVQGKLEATGNRDASRYYNFQYDAAGRMTRDQSKWLNIAYGYDAMPVEMAVRKDAAETVLYPLYDATGYRVSQVAATRLAHEYPVYIVGSVESGYEQGLYNATTIGNALADANYWLNFRNYPPDTLRVYVVPNAGVDTVVPDVIIEPLYKGDTLVPVVIYGVVKYSAAYDSLVAHHRGRKQFASHTINLDGWRVGEVREAYDAAGEVNWRRSDGVLYGRGGSVIGRRVQRGTSWEVQYYVKNHLGSTVRVVNADGSYATTPVFDYQAYGELQGIREDSANPVSARFTGKQLDSTVNLYYFGARWYDQELGVWGAPDNAKQFFSPYSNGDDFVNFVDIDGDVVVFATGIGNFSYDNLRRDYCFENPNLCGPDQYVANLATSYTSRRVGNRGDWPDMLRAAGPWAAFYSGNLYRKLEDAYLQGRADGSGLHVLAHSGGASTSGFAVARLNLKYGYGAVSSRTTVDGWDFLAAGRNLSYLTGTRTRAYYNTKSLVAYPAAFNDAAFGIDIDSKLDVINFDHWCIAGHGNADPGCYSFNDYLKDQFGSTYEWGISKPAEHLGRGLANGYEEHVNPLTYMHNTYTYWRDFDWDDPMDYVDAATLGYQKIGSVAMDIKRWIFD